MENPCSIPEKFSSHLRLLPETHSDARVPHELSFRILLLEKEGEHAHTLGELLSEFRCQETQNLHNLNSRNWAIVEVQRIMAAQ